MGKVDGLLVLGAITLLFFGVKRLPELGRSVGESVRELKRGFGSAEDASAGKPPVDTTESK